MKIIDPEKSTADAIVFGKEQLAAAIRCAVDNENGYRIELIRGDRMTVYRLPRYFSEASYKRIMKELAATPASAFK